MTTITVWLLFLTHSSIGTADKQYTQQPFTYISQEDCETHGKAVTPKWSVFKCLPATERVKVK